MKRQPTRLTLRPEDLRVASFATETAPASARGTVHAHEQPSRATDCGDSAQPPCPPATQNPHFCAVPTTDMPTARVDEQTNCI